VRVTRSISPESRRVVADRVATASSRVARAAGTGDCLRSTPSSSLAGRCCRSGCLSPGGWFGPVGYSQPIRVAVSTASGGVRAPSFWVRDLLMSALALCSGRNGREVSADRAGERGLSSWAAALGVAAGFSSRQARRAGLSTLTRLARSLRSCAALDGPGAANTDKFPTSGRSAGQRPPVKGQTWGVSRATASG
jgi:hypothetical protein